MRSLAFTLSLSSPKSRFVRSDRSFIHGGGAAWRWRARRWRGAAATLRSGGVPAASWRRGVVRAGVVRARRARRRWWRPHRVGEVARRRRRGGGTAAVLGERVEVVEREARRRQRAANARDLAAHRRGCPRRGAKKARRSIGNSRALGIYTQVFSRS